MKTTCVLLLLLVSVAGFAEEGAVLDQIPVVDLPGGGVSSYAILNTQSGSQLVVESSGPDGTIGFYALDLVDGVLRGRPIGAARLPARFLAPPEATPESRALTGESVGRYWRVPSAHSPRTHMQLVEFIPLPERRYVDVAERQHNELPPATARLDIGYLVVNADQEIESRCVLEYNLLRPAERLTTTSARWILAQGSPHLLVGMAVDRGSDAWPVFYRLYSQSLELVYQSPIVHYTGPNAFPTPITADLDGNGEDEVIVLSGEPAPVAGGEEWASSVIVLRPGPAAQERPRILALNDCATRMNGSDVVALQRALEQGGFSVGRYGIDGWYGPDTRAAVVEFQRRAALPVTGVVDEATWRALDLW